MSKGAPLSVFIDLPGTPPDLLFITRVVGKERIGAPYRYEIDLACRDPAGLDTSKIPGCVGALVFVEQGVEVRRITGLVCELLDRVDTETEFYTYRLILVPRAWVMTLLEMQEVYIEQSIPEIIKKKADTAGIGKAEDFELRLTGTYPKREFVVQYKETDLAFVSRWCEHLGVSFFFEQVDGRDKIIFTDHKDGFTSPGQPITFRSRGERRDVFRLDVRSRLVPAAYTVSDYNYEKPLMDLRGVFAFDGGFGGGVVEYGTNVLDPSEAAGIAVVRAEERQTEALSVYGESSACELTAGGRFRLEDHPRLGDVTLLVVEIEHTLHQTALGGGAALDQLAYKNTFRAIPAGATYRPERLTPRPRIYGVTQGVVEAAPGVDSATPWIDQHGRYLVRVLFDTAGVGERKASLPIRMAQPHSGPGYGVHFPLRPGTEVMLVFIDGDPDRPIIAGSVPNALTPTPVNEAERTLHRQRTWSGVLVEIDDGG